MLAILSITTVSIITIITITTALVILVDYSDCCYCWDASGLQRESSRRTTIVSIPCHRRPL